MLGCGGLHRGHGVPARLGPERAADVTAALTVPVRLSAAHHSRDHHRGLQDASHSLRAPAGSLVVSNIFNGSNVSTEICCKEHECGDYFKANVRYINPFFSLI